jgi:hypothetical protein
MNVYRTGFAALFVLILSAIPTMAQHNHGEDASPASPATPAPGGEKEAIFCPTMKTGQLCSHGTAANLHLTGEKEQQWLALARAYNKSVDAATERLLKDAEGVLAPDQLALLKAWFAIGLNPKINELLYASDLPKLK